MIETKEIAPETRRFLMHWAHDLKLGTPMLRALRQAEVATQPTLPLTKAIKALRLAIQRGDALTDAMGYHRNIFPREAIRHMRGTEQARNFITVLEEIARMGEVSR